jgi:hypothetical protein
MANKKQLGACTPVVEALSQLELDENAFGASPDPKTNHEITKIRNHEKNGLIPQMG